MARPEQQSTGEQAIPESSNPASNPAARADKRLRDAIEDDEAREALKSLQARQNAAPEAPDDSRP